MKNSGSKPLLFWSVSLLLAVFFLLHAGELLVVQDSFSRAEVALVLSGDPIRRALAARDIYVQGRVDRILIIPESADPVLSRELDKLGLGDPTGTQLSVRILTAAGIPAAKIALLSSPADGTIREAAAVKRYFAEHPPSSIALITSKSASRRARFIFRSFLPMTRVFSSPSGYDMFESRRWWFKPRNALTVVMEYQKFLANCIEMPLAVRAGR